MTHDSARRGKPQVREEPRKRLYVVKEQIKVQLIECEPVPPYGLTPWSESLNGVSTGAIPIEAADGEELLLASKWDRKNTIFWVDSKGSRRRR